MSTRNKAGMAIRIIGSLVFSVGMLAGFSGTAAAQPSSGTANFCTDYDNANDQSYGLFTDLRRGAGISADGECVLNLDGSVGSAGDLWITLLDAPTPPATLPSSFPTFSCVVIDANVLIKKYDNRKAVGFVTNYDAGGKTGLFFGLYDNGNTDALTLSTFNGTTGKLTGTVATLPLGSKIKENDWYALHLDICTEGGDLSGYGSVKPADLTPPTRLAYNDSFDEMILNFPEIALQDIGIETYGQIGIAGYAKSAFVNSSVTNFSWADTSCLPGLGLVLSCN